MFSFKIRIMLLSSIRTELKLSNENWTFGTARYATDSDQDHVVEEITEEEQKEAKFVHHAKFTARISHFAVEGNSIIWKDKVNCHLARGRHQPSTHTHTKCKYCF
jgi:hypothetical protein